MAKLESLLVKNGFSEVINFPFTPNKEKESINIDNFIKLILLNLYLLLMTLLVEIYKEV